MTIPASVTAGAVECPHPERLSRAAVRLDGGRGAMAVCFPCALMLNGLIRGWHQGELGPAVVVATMRQNGYTRRDAAQFLLQLAADSLKVRLGFAQREDLTGG